MTRSTTILTTAPRTCPRAGQALAKHSSIQAPHCRHATHWTTCALTHQHALPQRPAPIRRAPERRARLPPVHRWPRGNTAAATRCQGPDLTGAHTQARLLRTTKQKDGLRHEATTPHGHRDQTGGGGGCTYWVPVSETPANLAHMLTVPYHALPPPPACSPSKPPSRAGASVARNNRGDQFNRRPT